MQQRYHYKLCARRHGIHAAFRATAAQSIKMNRRHQIIHSTCLLTTILLLSCLLPNAARGADILPTGGVVVAGSGDIQSNGSHLVVTQSTDRMAMNWQTFSIGQNNSVTFVQPSSASVALNRVLGSDVSVIQGALTANGQIFLVNPNGVLFTPSARVETGGLVASTLTLSTEDFLAGRYAFAGSSSNAIINEGNVTTANGGTIALIAAHIINTGTLTAPEGRVLIGAGQRVTLDLGGPVKIDVEQAAIDALIEQGGAIKADGGLIYLTAKAANELATTVINNTGVIEAQTLATGQKGEIYLVGDMHNDRIVVGGRINADAPNGGDAGFVETSAANVDVQDDAHVSAAASQGQAGTWLIDPTNIAIAAASCTGTNCIAANTISSTLDGGTNVSIATSSSGAEAGNITVNAPISWGANKLTLSAHNNIVVNSNLTATNTGNLVFEYGQATTDGGSSTYTVASNAKILIPNASSFTWKKGSSGSTNNLVFNNTQLRFGNGTEASINDYGQLKQPFYYDNTSVVNNVTRDGWFKLTYSSYPLDIQIGAGGDGTNSWNTNGSTVNTQSNNYTPISGSRSLDISRFLEGKGTIVTSVNLSVAGNTLNVSNTYTLSANVSYLKTDTLVTNLNSADTASNVRVWVGTRDDWVGLADSSYKYRGNLTSNGFEQITDSATQAKALKIAERNDNQGATVLFYSTSDGAETSVNGCCSFTNATNTNPRTSTFAIGPIDGSYALYQRLSDLTPGQSGGLTWYYAASSASLIENVVTEVSQSSGVIPDPTPEPEPPPPTPEPESEPTPEPVVDTRTPQITAAIESTVTHVETVQTVTARPTVEAPAVITGHAAFNEPVQSNITSGLQIVELSADVGTSPTTESSASTEAAPSSSSEAQADDGVLTQAETTTSFDFFKVFVVSGGIKMPTDTPEDDTK